MPTYEYQCQNCKCRFERFESMSAEPLKHCPQCGGPVERLISGGAGVIFKGAGFYATDDSGARPSCGLDRTCCGRETPCESKPCDSRG
ncbi:MAG: FmdB family zinc ribbon protein [Bryobacteraceae bacterium]